MAKKTKKVIEDVIITEPVVEPVEEPKESVEKTRYREFLDIYAKQNPKAWEMRSARLLAKLEGMK